MVDVVGSTHLVVDVVSSTHLMVDVVGSTHLVVDVVGELVGLGALPVQYDVASVRHDDHVPAHVESRVVRADPRQVNVACRRLKQQRRDVYCQIQMILFTHGKKHSALKRIYNSWSSFIHFHAVLETKLTK